MESLLKEATQIASDFEYQAEIYFVEAMALCIEGGWDTGILTEKKRDTDPDPIGVKIKKFFTSIYLGIEQFISSISIGLVSSAREAETKSALRKLHAELEEKRAKGIKKVTVIDVWGLEEVCTAAVDDLSGLAKKFAKVDYTSTITLDKDLQKFEEKYKKWEKKIQEAKERTIEVSVETMIKYCDDEVRRRTKFLKNTNKAKEMIAIYKDLADRTMVKYKALGPDVLPKYTPIDAIFRFIKKIVSFIFHIIKKVIVTVFSIPIKIIKA